MVGLPDGEKTLSIMYNRLVSIPACDRRTSCDGTVRTMHTRRAVKMVPFQNLGAVSYSHSILYGHIFSYFNTIRERDRQPARHYTTTK